MCLPPLAPAELTFIENQGQWETDARYVARRGDLVVRVEPGSLVLDRRRLDGTALADGVMVRLVFEGSSHGASIEGAGRRSGLFNFYLGNDRRRWRVGVPGWTAVIYRGLYPGVDLQVRNSCDGLEYDLIAAADVDLAGVRVRVQGAEEVRCESEGKLMIDTVAGPLRQSAPRAWQVTPTGELKPVACRTELLDTDTFGFTASGWDREHALLIDPGLDWSTYLGGSLNEDVTGMAMTANGDIVLCGLTVSPNFPVMPGAYQLRLSSAVNGNADAFVTRIKAGGSTLVYSTYFGGSYDDQAFALDLDEDEGVVIAGASTSTDLPITPGAFSAVKQGSTDAFIARFSPSGSDLILSTYLGAPGLGYEQATGVAIDQFERITVAGHTILSGFPTTPGAFDPTWNGGTDGFVARLTSDGGGLVFSTYLGGTGTIDDVIRAMAVEESGEVTVAGTASRDFPTTPRAFQPVAASADREAFVTRLSADGSRLVYSTFLGGVLEDQAYAIARAAGGEVVVVGKTFSDDFPTTPDAFAVFKDSSSALATYDVFVARLTATGSGLVWSSYLGGASHDAEPLAVAVDGSGAVTVGGRTWSPVDFPTTPGAFSSVNAGTDPNLSDAFVTRFHPSGGSLIYSTYLGGAKNDVSANRHVALATDAMGSVVVSGWTGSMDFPVTPGALQPQSAGLSDLFVTKIDMLAKGVSKFGSSTPGCQGPIAIGAIGMPQVGATGFWLTCSNAPPGAQGLLLLGFASVALPVPAVGIELWLDPTGLVALVPEFADGQGFVQHRVRIPANPLLAGLTFCGQFAWPDVCDPDVWTGSNALAVTIQP